MRKSLAEGTGMVERGMRIDEGKVTQRGGEDAINSGVLMDSKRIY